MADKKPLSTLQSDFEAIRDERRTHANTAERIGNALLSILPYMGNFLRRDQPETVQYLLTLLGGAVIGKSSQITLNPDGSISCKQLGVEGNAEVSGLLKIGGATLSWDSASNALKVDKGIYSESFVSALGKGGSGGTGYGALSDLLDVNISSPDNGQVLKYNSLTGKWYNGTDEGVTSLGWAAITGKPTTIAGYGISDAKIANGVITIGTNSIKPLTSFTETDPTVPSWAKASQKPSYAFSELTSHPTTLLGYGITDTHITNGVITLGGNTITPVTSVAMSVPQGFVITGTPITKTGTLALSYQAGYEGFRTEWKNDVESKLSQLLSWFEEDSDGNVHTKDIDGKHRGFYSESFISALGKSSGSDGGIIDVETVWTALKNATTEQINISHLTDALSGYATESWVLQQRYLTEDQYKGTVAQVKVGTTAYNPTDGVVSLPSYPTTLPASDVYPWAKAAQKPSYAFSEITGTVANTQLANNTVTVNGTSVSLGGSITTSKWGTARNITIKDADSTNSGSSVSVNGGADVTLLLPKTIKAALSGNATSATQLLNTRTIWGQNFNGTADVSGAITGATSIGNNGAFVYFRTSNGVSITAVESEFTVNGDTSLGLLYVDDVATFSSDVKIDGRLKIGDIYVSYDQSNSALKVYKLDSHNNEVAANLYALGGVSALGQGVSGGGGTGDVTWDLLASNTDTRQIALSHLTTALANYATQGWVIGRNYLTVSSADSKYTYYAGTGLSLSGTTFNIVRPTTGNWFNGTPYIQSGGVMEVGRIIDFHPTGVSSLDFNVRIDAGTGTEARTFTFADTGGTLLSSGNSSVSLDGSTLTVKINGTSQSLTNTWRGIQDNLTSDSSTESLSAKQGKALKGSITTLEGYFTNGVANSAAQLQNARTLWGQSFNGTANVSGAMTGVTSIGNNGAFVYFRTAGGVSITAVESEFTVNGDTSLGLLYVDDIYISYDESNNALKLYKLSGGKEVAANLYALGGVSALGVGSSDSGGGIDIDAMWSALGNPTTNQINVSHLTTALAPYATISSIPTSVSQLTNDSGYITSSALNGYATEGWVMGRNYVTATVAASTYVKKAGDTMMGTLVSQDITPSSDNTYTLGSKNKQWADLRAIKASISGDLGVGGRLSIWGTVQPMPTTQEDGTVIWPTFGSDEFRWANIATKGLNCDGNIIPSSNGSHQLGMGNWRWGLVAAVDGDFSGRVSASNYVSAGVYMSAPEFRGSLNGNASTATRATQDGSGNTITSTYLTKNEAQKTYLPLAGGTLTGRLYVKGNILPLSTTASDGEVTWPTLGSSSNRWANVVTSGVNSAGNIVPSATNNYQLGTSSLRWKAIVAGSGDFSSFVKAATYVSAGTYMSAPEFRGNATSATQLLNTRTIWGQNFNGTADVSGAMTGVTSIGNGSAFVYFRTTSNLVNITAVESEFSVNGDTSLGLLYVDDIATFSSDVKIDGRLKIGDIYISYDESNNALKLYKLSGGKEVAANLYALGGVSALGVGSSDSGGGIDIDAMWSALGNPTTEQINVSHLTTALSGYATQSWVSQNYALKSDIPTLATLSWSGYSSGSYNGSEAKTISIPNNTNQLTNGAGFITSAALSSYVTQVKVGTTPYNPSSGVVSLPDYLKLSGNTTSTPITGILYIKDTDGLFINSSNTDLNIWQIVGNAGSWASQFGFNLQYLGTGSGNSNDLILWAHNQGGTHKESYRIHQDGQFVFKSVPYVGDNAVWHSGNLTKVSQLTNDSGYVTSSGVTSVTLKAGSGISLDVDNTAITSTGTRTITNSGVRATTINGNYLRVNTNGANADLTIPYATSAGNASTADLANMIKNNITVTSDSSHDNGIWFNNGTRSVLFGTGTSGNTGIYLTGKGWIVGVNSSGTAFLNGNSSSATKLQTARTIWGQSFDGSGNVSGDMNDVGDVTMTGSEIYSTAGLLVLNAGRGSVEIGYSGNDTTKGYARLDSYNYRLIVDDADGITLDASQSYITGLLKVANTIQIGDIYIGYDQGNNALKVYKVVGGSEVAANLYALGGVSALGVGSSGGGGGTGDVTWDLLASSTDTRQIALSHLTTALTNYATQGWVIGRNYITVSSADSKYTYYAGTGLSLSGTTFNIVRPKTGDWFNGTPYVQSGGVMEVGRVIDFHPTGASSLDFNVRIDAGTGTTARTFTFADTGGTLLSSGNSSVSLDGSTLTVKINGTSQSLTNTWRGIQNNLTSTSATDSLSAAQGKVLSDRIDGLMYLNDIELESTGVLKFKGHNVDDITVNLLHTHSFSELEGTVANTQLANPSMTINGSLVSLGGTVKTSLWGVARTITVKDNSGTNSKANTGIDGSANFDLLLPATIKASLTGNADSATKLQTSRTIWGQSFDGTGDITSTFHLYTGNRYNEIITPKGSPTYGVVKYTTWDAGSNMGICRIQSTYGRQGLCIGFASHIAYTTDISAIEGATFADRFFIGEGGNVGIGTTSPTHKLDVNGTLNVSGTSTLANISMSGGITSTVNDFTIQSGYSSINVITDYSGGFPSGSVDLSSIDYSISINDNDGIVLSTDNFSIQTYGDNIVEYKVNEGIHSTVGIYSDSYISALGQNTSSDIRKKDVEDYNALPTVEQVALAPAIHYTWKQNKALGRQIGSVAQYWLSVLPEGVKKDFKGFLSMQYDVIALLASIATAKRVVDHEKRISELEKENERLRTEIEQLKAA